MRNLIAALVPPLVLWMAGCSPRSTGPSETTTSEGQKSQAPAGTTAARQDTALVRFINADPAGSGKDLWSDDMRLFNSVAFKMITEYVEVKPHVLQFHLRDAGAGKDLAANQREMFPGRHYSVVALSKGAYSTRLPVLRDDLGALEPGVARVRLINATSDVKDLDLFIQSTSARIGHGVDPSIANASTEVAPGMLEIRQTGKPALQPLTNLKVEADGLYTFIVTGTADALDVFRVVDRVER